MVNKNLDKNARLSVKLVAWPDVVLDNIEEISKTIVVWKEKVEKC